MIKKIPFVNGKIIIEIYSLSPAAFSKLKIHGTSALHHRSSFLLHIFSSSLCSYSGNCCTPFQFLIFLFSNVVVLRVLLVFLVFSCFSCFSCLFLFLEFLFLVFLFLVFLFLVFLFLVFLFFLFFFFFFFFFFSFFFFFFLFF